MPSFQISITPNRRAAARFVTDVRRKILKALEEENKKRGLKQTDLARAINVHRSVINRELRGKKDMAIGRVAELGWALGRVPTFDLPERVIQGGTNLPKPAVASGPSIGSSQDKRSARKESNRGTTEPLRNVIVKVLEDAPV
jgi:transcriptional regulator with XRE-family HTH domain